MKRSRFRSLWLTLSLCVLVAVLLLYGTATTSAAPDGMRGAWERARQAGAYHFSADILQTTIPLPTVINVGRQSRQDRLYVEGQTNLSDETLELTVWSQGGSLLRAEDGLQVRVEEGRARARQGAGAWEEIEDFSGLFAPQGDALAYLVAARDVVEAGTEARAGRSFTRYTFQVDGRRFAASMRDQLERQLAERGELPPGVGLELPRLYVEMTGQGELWVGEDGLPLRQILHLQFPEGEDERVEAEVDVTFSDFGPGAVQNLPRSLIGRLSPERALKQGGVLMATLALLMVIVLYRRSKKVYAALIVVIIVSMVVTPLLQSVRAAAFAERQATRAREQEQRQQEAQWRRELDDRLQSAEARPATASPDALALAWIGDGTDSDIDGQMDVQALLKGSDLFRVQPGSAGTGVGQGSPAVEEGVDTDGDGLTDYEEVLLGTSPVYADSDGDLITDTLEVTGYVYTTTTATETVTATFYSDPLAADSNRDGIADWSEWYASSDGTRPGDTDGDGVPDIVDRDNDGDGVPDDLDLSPFQTSGEGRVFDGGHPFSLIVDNLEPGKPTLVEFQVRPTNPDHLWYAFNVLDWPEDRQGQIQDGDGLSYADVHPSATDSAGLRTNENGDIKLLPMLEIIIPGEGDPLPEESTLERMYGVSVQDLGALGMGEGKIAYVPLQLVSDRVGGARVAFSGRMLYLPGESWAEAHQVRLVWAVQALLDTCAEDGWEDGQCKVYKTTNEAQIVQRYDDEWVLTGLKVREDRGQEAGIIWEDPERDDDLDDDDALVLLSQVLDETFLSGRDCDTPSGEGRCQGDGERDITVGELSRRLSLSPEAYPVARWSLPDILAMETFTYTHQDQALMSLVLTNTQKILKENFTPYWSEASAITPTLLFVQEQVFRASNLDAVASGEGLAWGGEEGRELRVDMGAEGIQPITMASASWKPYRYDASTGWENCPVESYWAELERRYLDRLAGGGDPEEARGELFLFQFYYLTGYSGVSEIVQRGDGLAQQPGAAGLSADTELTLEIVNQAGGAVKSIVSNLDAATLFYGNVFRELAGKKGLYDLPATDMTPETRKAIGDIDRLRLESGSGRARSNAVWSRDAIPKQPLKSQRKSGFGAVAIAGLSLTALNIGLLMADHFADTKGLEIAADISTYTLTAVGVGLGALEICKSLKLVHTMVKSGMTSTAALSASSEVAGASKAAAKIGLIISIGITVAFFVVGLVEGLQAGANNVQIQTMIAQAIAQIIMAVVMFVLAATIVGSIIVAIIIILDTILSAVGLEDYTTAALLAKVLYGYSQIAEPNCALGDSTRTFIGPEQGIVAGNEMVLTQTITATATMTDPSDFRAIPYLPTLWTESMLKNSEVRCELGKEGQDLSSNDTAWQRVVGDHVYHGWNMVWNMRSAEADATANITLPLAAGINYKPALYLNMGYEVPVANCWWLGLLIPPICYPTWIEDSYSTDLGALMPIDILPATLDGFYWWDELGVQQDHDGDGLRAVAVQGNDPKDGTWDADGDGLSDTYELERRSRGGEEGGARPSPLSADTDGDGLSDADEIRLGTFPNLRDSDGDGVKDSQEVWHYDVNEKGWRGGWAYTYTFTNAQGEPETQTIRVTSDPLSADTDGDGLNDGVEQALGENPRSWTPNPQGLQVEISDADGIVGPEQSLVYTATLENQIEMDPGYFLTGTLTATLPSALGGGVLTRPYNVYQGESVSIVQALSVAKDAASGEAVLASQARGWMHDGYITDTYRLDPAGLETTGTSSAPAYANIAALPDGDEPNPDESSAFDLFAVASAEGTVSVTLRFANQAFSDVIDERVKPDCGPGVGVRPYAPGIACADEGTCLTTWSNVHDDNCTEITIYGIEALSQWDGDGEGDRNGDYYLLVNGTKYPPQRAKFTATRSLNTLTTGIYRELSITQEFCGDVTLELKDDDTFSSDDSLGIHSVSYCSAGQGDHVFGPDQGGQGQVQLWWGVAEKRKDGIYARTVTGTGTSTAVSDGTLNLSGPDWETGRQRPAVASNGTDFLVVWQEPSESGDQAIYARPVSHDGTAGTTIRLDAPGPGDDDVPAVAWAGEDRYLVVWYSSASHGIEMAYVDASGTYVEGSRQTLASDAIWAQAAANPDAGQVLVVYTKGCDSGPCIRGRLVDLAGGSGWPGNLGPEIGLADGVHYSTAPAVAYEPTYGGWLVSWAPGYWAGPWQAQYWNINNTDLQLYGEPALERVEPELDHDWGWGSPHPPVVESDRFYAQWTRDIVVPAGTYHITATSDDYIRVQVDDQLVIDHWSLSRDVYTRSVTRTLSSGPHWLRVAYYDNSEQAEARLTWERTDDGAPALSYLPLSAAGEPLLVKEGRGPEATFHPISGSVPIDDLHGHAVACSPETTDYAQCDLVASSNDQLTLQPLFLELVPALVGPITTTVLTTVTVDADPPTATVRSLVDGQSLGASGRLVIGGEAGDATSGVAGVQIRVDDGPWQDAEGAESWVYAWQVPGSEGPVKLSTRATDLVGNTGPAETITVTIDRTPPQVDLDAGEITSARHEAGQWSLSLKGTARDRYSDVARVEVLVTPNGNGWQRATVEGDTWRLDYALSSFGSDGSPLVDASGIYTVQVKAVDAAGNETGSRDAGTVRVDTAPPEVTVTYPTTRTAAITTTISLRGEITDPGPVAAGLGGLEVSFTPAGGSPDGWLPARLEEEGPGVTHTGWELALPGDLEGLYQIDLHAEDLLGNDSDNPAEWAPWRGEIDTLAPRAVLTVTQRGAGQAAQTVYEGRAEDLNLSREGFESPCAIQAADVHYYDEAWWMETTGDTRRLFRLMPACITSGTQEGAPSLRACDGYGRCTVASGTVVSEPVTVTVASAVLTPAHESVLTSTDPVSLTLGAFALDGLDTLTLTVNGVVKRSLAWAGQVSDTITTTTWTPPGEGHYRLVTEARDRLGNLQSDLQPITITVDLEEPSVAMATDVLTTAHRLSFRRVALSGPASDTVGLEEVRVSVDGGDWEAAWFDGETWRYPWWLGPGEGEPDGESHEVAVRATDAAGHTAEVREAVTVDLVPPVPVTVTLAYDAGDGPVPLEAGQTIRAGSATLIMSWTERSDDAGGVVYAAGWSEEMTPTVGLLAPAMGGGYQKVLSGTQALYAHVVAWDSNGNSRVQTVGPVYLDGPETPDLVADLDYHGWMASGCTQMGADREMARHAEAGATLAGTQRLYASWDEEALRLTWTGADWNVIGDLFVYLDTQAGVGATTAYDPYGSGPAIGLPDGMAADYVVMVEDGQTARLLTWNGNTWDGGNGELDGTQYRLDAGRSRTDLRIPFELLSYEPGTAMSLVVLASEEDALRIWATMPDKNPLNSELAVNPLALDYLGQDFALTQLYRWPSLDDGQCPNEGQFANADLQVSLGAEPPGLEVGFLEHDLPGLLRPGEPLDGKADVTLPLDDVSVLLGDGQTVTYTLSYANLGASIAPGAVVTLTARGALTLPGGVPMTVPLEAVSGTVRITGTIDTKLNGESAELDDQSAELDGVVADATHGAYDWLWVQHGVDTEPPTGLQFLAPAGYIGPGPNQASGLVSDPSGVPTITLEVRGTEPLQIASLAPAPSAVPTATLTCTDTTPRDGTWACTWDAGSALDGTEIGLRARATDRFGATGEWTGPVTVTVDATPPTVTLSAETEAALGQDELLGPDDLWFRGQVTDTHQAAGVQVCVRAPGEETAYCELFDATPGERPQVADWQAPAPVPADSDGMARIFSFYGYDSVGNRTPEPLTATARVDIVAPAVVATPTLSQVLQGTRGTVLEGTVHDGSGVERLQVYVAGPGLEVRWYNQDDDELQFDGEAWQFDVRFDEPGAYSLGLEAWDVAGNVRRRGPFPVEVLRPAADLSLTLSASPESAIGGLPLGYTARVANDGRQPAPSTVLTFTLPAGVDLLRAPGSCDQDGDSLVCSLGDLSPGPSVPIDLGVQVPVEITRTLVCQGTVRSRVFDPDPSNNQRSLSTPVQPYSPDAELVCDGPNLLANGGFEQGFQPSGVANAWVAFDNGGEATYSYRDDRWDPVVSEGEHSQLIKIDSIDLGGPTEPDHIAGIYQGVRMIPGVTYELSVEAMMRERREHPMEDPYRYMVGWGTSGEGGTNPARMDLRAWLPLRTIYPMNQPGDMQSYRTRFEASSKEMTLWLFAMKKWATLGRELNVNLDGATLRMCRPVTTDDVQPPW